MALEDKLYCINNLKHLKNFNDSENYVATKRKKICVVKPLVNIIHV